MIYTHQVWFYTEKVKLLHRLLNFNKQITQITDINYNIIYPVSEWVKIVAIYALLV